MDIERGKYLIVVGGCNDCHTPGYLLEDGNSPLGRLAARRLARLARAMGNDLPDQSQAVFFNND